MNFYHPIVGTSHIFRMYFSYLPSYSLSFFFLSEINNTTKVPVFMTVPLLFSKKEKEKTKRSKCILYFYVHISDWFLSTTETLPTLKSLVVIVLLDDALYAHCFQIFPKVRNFHDRKRKRRSKRGEKRQNITGSRVPVRRHRTFVQWHP